MSEVDRVAEILSRVFKRSEQLRLLRAQEEKLRQENFEDLVRLKEEAEKTT